MPALLHHDWQVHSEGGACAEGGPMAMKGDYYHSTTHGRIKLSIKARELFNSLRISISESIAGGKYTESVAHARGELAQYISILENPQAMTATEVNIRQEAARILEQKWRFNQLPYQKDLMNAMLYGRPDTWKSAKPIPLGAVVSYHGADWANPITGTRPDMIVIDDPLNQQPEMTMAIKKKLAAKVKAEAKLQTVGVRFLTGGNLAKVYTYKAKRSAKLHLGQEVAARSDSDSYGLSVGVVVELNGPVPAGYSMESLKELTLKVAPL
jgi:hypothetical protein